MDHRRCFKFQLNFELSILRLSMQQTSDWHHLGNVRERLAARWAGEHRLGDSGFSGIWDWGVAG